MLQDKIVWKLVMKPSDNSQDKDLTLEFTDTSTILGEPVISNAFLEEILKLCETNDTYVLMNNLKTIISDKGEEIDRAAIWVLMGIVAQNSQRVGLLLGTLENGGVHIIASWPDTFTDQLRTDTSLVDVVLNKFVNSPEFWEQVDLIVRYR